MLSSKVRSGVNERHAILQLIAEPVRAARLIERRACPYPAGERLIERPAIEDEIHCAIGRFDLNGAEHGVPVLGYLFEHLAVIGCAVTRDQCADVWLAGCLPQQHDDLRRPRGCELERRAKRGTGIETGAGGARERRIVGERGRTVVRSVSTEEFATVRRPFALSSA